MKNKKILLLMGDTYRSNLYCQYLKNNSIVFKPLLYGFGKDKILPELDKITREFFESQNFYIPKTNIGVRSFLEESKIEYESLSEKNINSHILLDKIKEINPDIVIFSGYGGDILNYKHFSENVNYIHMHPGDIPTKKGSTTIFYSILNKGFCTVTSFFMNDKIDSGQIIKKINFKKPDYGVNIDVFYDNLIRSFSLIETLKFLRFNEMKSINNKMNSNLEYFIIHPVLKHLSILSLK